MSLHNEAILSRWQTRQWNVEIPLIISNHEIARETAEKFGIRFYHLPVFKEKQARSRVKAIGTS